MLPLDLFRARNFTIGNVARLTAYLGLGGVIILLPVFLQEVSGYSLRSAPCHECRFARI